MALIGTAGDLTMQERGLLIKRVYSGRPADYIQRCMGEKQCKRGKQITFSRFSALNLKRKLVSLPWGDGVVMYGITLTVQAAAYAAEADPVETFRKHWQSFVVQVSKSASNGVFAQYFSFIWRIELTKQGTPHFHCIISTNNAGDVLIFQQTWVRLVSKWYGYVPHENVAAQYRRIDNCSAAFAYVGAHASKHKREQLGWQGRQWGVICPTKTAKAFYQSFVGSRKGTLPWLTPRDGRVGGERRQG